MMILAFMGSDLPAQNKLIQELAKEIRPDYRVKKILLPSTGHGLRVNLLKSAIAAAPAPDVVTVFPGITREDEIAVLSKRRAFFCVLPGVLPRVLSQGKVAIDERFIFVAHDPVRLEDERKRKMFCRPDEAFSRCLVAEIRAGGFRHAAC